MTKHRLLLIEDSRTQARSLVEPLVAAGYDVTWADTGATGIRLAAELIPDCVLLDVELPDIDGFGVCRFLTSRAATREIPIIMLTSRAAVQDRIRGLGTGAVDYIAKPFDFGELEARVRACLRTVSLQREVHAKNQQLEDLLERFRVLASTDELTGLFNRRRFFEELDREFARHVRYRSPLTLVLVDVDHFKSVNDSLGHQAGDSVLREVGHLLNAAFRRTDTAARYGGEEFAVLMPETDVDEAREAAERFRELVEATAFRSADTTIDVTISAGVAAAGGAVDTPDMLVRAADRALYSAKSRGRNRIVVASDLTEGSETNI